MRERGFSLVETLVAVGVTSSIVLSIAGMFVLGTRQVQSGRFLSEATQTGQGIVEELQTLEHEDLYTLINGQDADITVTWSSDQPVPTYTGRGADMATANAEMLNRWRTRIEQVLPRGGYELTMTGYDNRPEGMDDGTAAFWNSRFIHVELRVFWTERPDRNRDVVFNLLRF